jgi:uncharacterized membrane protein
MNDKAKNEPSNVHLVDGRLHTIEEIRDASGKLIANIASPLRVEVKWEDLVQLFAGALMLGAPVAFTEEVWVLGETLPPGRIVLIFFLSILINGFFVKMLFYRNNLSQYRVEFIKRVCAAYAVPLLVALLLLALIDQGPLDDPLLALRRAVIIAFPASFAAIALDYIR